MGLDAEGVVWMSGKLRTGGPWQSNTFTRVQFPDTPGRPPVRCAGLSCQDEHAVVWTAEGRLFSWGKGESGQLGNGTTENLDVPHQCKHSRRFRSPARRQERPSR